jgi:hypothetical protein
MDMRKASLIELKEHCKKGNEEALKEWQHRWNAEFPNMDTGGMALNINFEEDTRHDVSNKALRRLEKVMFQQDDFGVKKYGKPLNSSMDYDWLQMAQEEQADMSKYLECERQRREHIRELLEKGKVSNNPKLYINMALDLLSYEGTGK